jgi:hypothetical protein
MSEITNIKTDLASYKVRVSEQYVRMSVYTNDQSEIKALLREIRDEIRDHERNTREKG